MRFWNRKRKCKGIKKTLPFSYLAEAQLLSFLLPASPRPTPGHLAAGRPAPSSAATPQAQPAHPLHSSQAQRATPAQAELRPTGMRPHLPSLSQFDNRDPPLHPLTPCPTGQNHLHLQLCATRTPPSPPCLSSPRFLSIWRDLHAKLPIKLRDPLRIHLRRRSSLGFALSLRFGSHRACVHPPPSVSTPVASPTSGSP